MHITEDLEQTKSEAERLIQERDMAIAALRKQHYSYGRIAKLFGLSRQRVAAILLRQKKERGGT